MADCFFGLILNCCYRQEIYWTSPVTQRWANVDSDTMSRHCLKTLKVTCRDGVSCRVSRSQIFEFMLRFMKQIVKILVSTFKVACYTGTDMWVFKLPMKTWARRNWSNMNGVEAELFEARKVFFNRRSNKDMISVIWESRTWSWTTQHVEKLSKVLCLDFWQ